MGFFDFFRRKPAQTRALTADVFRHLGLLRPSTASGIHVDEQTALTISTFYRAVKVKAESVGSMPCKAYVRTTDGRDEATEHHVYDLVHREPNPEMSAVEFWTTMERNLTLYNVAYAEIERVEGGPPEHLWPLSPTRVAAFYEGGQRKYKVQGDDGTETVLTEEFMLAVRGTHETPLCDLARESLGLTLAMERHGAAYFGNAARPSLVLEHPGELSDEARQNLIQSYRTQYQGTDKAGAVLLLEEGLKAQTVQVSNEQGQYTESRERQSTAACQWAGVDPVICYEYGRATWANATQGVLN